LKLVSLIESRTPPSQLREMFSKVEPTDDSLHKKSADVGMDSVGADRFLKEGAGQKTTPAAYTPNPKKHYPNAEDNAAYLAHFDGVDVTSGHRQLKKWQQQTLKYVLKGHTTKPKKGKQPKKTVGGADVMAKLEEAIREGQFAAMAGEVSHTTC
jgi:hypothetical protein